MTCELFYQLFGVMPCTLKRFSCFPLCTIRIGENRLKRRSPSSFGARAEKKPTRMELFAETIALKISGVRTTKGLLCSRCCDLSFLYSFPPHRVKRKIRNSPQRVDFFTNAKDFFMKFPQTQQTTRAACALRAANKRGVS